MCNRDIEVFLAMSLRTDGDLASIRATSTPGATKDLRMLVAPDPRMSFPGMTKIRTGVLQYLLRVPGNAVLILPSCSSLQPASSLVQVCLAIRGSLSRSVRLVAISQSRRQEVFPVRIPVVVTGASAKIDLFAWLIRWKS